MENRELVPQTPQDPTTMWTPEQVDTIKKTVAIGANDSELKMFLSIAGTYGLDPFLHEIWFVQMRGRNTIITSRDGYLKIANRTPAFDGMVSDVVFSNDKFYKEGDSVKHLYNAANRGQIIGAYATVYRKDRNHPAYCFAQFREYNKGGGVWSQYPSAMIQKVAESMALKRAFSISGLVTEEEISTAQIQEQPQTQSPQPEQPTQAEKERQALIKQLWDRYLAVFDNHPELAQRAMIEISGKSSTADFTQEDIAKLFDQVKEMEYQKMDAEVAAQQQQNTQGEIVEAEQVSDIPQES